MRAPLPDNEHARLLALESLRVLDTPREPAFDDLAWLAGQICEAPVCLISLVDDSRQWFKSRVGIELKETAREYAFCAHALDTPDDILLVSDTLLDPRFADNPLVTGPRGIRFYAGAPLSLDNGLVLGTLCVMDTKARSLTSNQVTALKKLAAQVVSQLQHRCRESEINELQRKQEAGQALMEECLEHFPGTVFRCLNDDYFTFISSCRSIEKLTGYPLSDFTVSHLRCFHDLYHPDDRQRILQQFKTSMSQRQPYDIRYRIIHADGQERWVREVGQGVYEQGALVHISGVIWEITEPGSGS